MPDYRHWQGSTHGHPPLPNSGPAACHPTATRIWLAYASAAMGMIMANLTSLLRRFIVFARHCMFLESEELHNLYTIVHGPTAVGSGTARCPALAEWGRGMGAWGRTMGTPRLPVRTTRNKYTLVLDLDETLVHTSRQPMPGFDFRVEVNIDRNIYPVYVKKRPYLDVFLTQLHHHYNLVIFTASLQRYADVVVDAIDRHCLIRRRFFREDCTATFIDGKRRLAKELATICEDMRRVIIIDNSPEAYVCNEDNAIPITTWYSDTSDKDLLNLIPFLISLRKVTDVRSVLSRRSGPGGGKGMEDQPARLSSPWR